LLFDWPRWRLHRRFTLAVFHSRPTDRSMTALNELRISNCEFRDHAWTTPALLIFDTAITKFEIRNSNFEIF